MTIWNVLCRKKQLSDSSSNEKTSNISRVAGFKDLLLLGVGSTFGVGVYILAGSVVHLTGPSVVISFAIAAFAATLSGLCYAEFGVRLPKAGSAYTYIYVCIGEFVAFIVGWILVLEHIIGPASISRGVSSYLDSILSMSINETMKDAFSEVAYLGNTTYWSSYFDFFAFGLPIVASGLVAFGLQESLMLNVICISINILVVMFIIIAGATVANKENWNGDIFFSNGIIDMIKGAATCFFGFVGFDCIATTGEEVRRPQKMLPLTILFTLFIVFVVYFGISAVITLMGNLFSQNMFTTLAYEFGQCRQLWPGASWIVAIGAFLGLTTSLFGAMFPLPRIIYAMALDGLLFPFLGSVNSQFKTTLVTTLISGVLTGVVAAVFDLNQLIEMMSLGALIVYTLVAACVLLLRYRPNEENFNNNSYVNTKTTSLPSYTVKRAMKQLINVHCHEKPSQLTFSIIVIEIISFSVLSLGMGVAVLTLDVNLETKQPFAIAIVGIIGCFLILLLISMSSQPREETHLAFQVPLVPLIPALCMFVNLYLMVMLSYETWIRFALWMIVGFSIYLLYGTNHSKVERDSSQQSYNGRILSISRVSNEDYNMPTAPVHISIQAPTPSPSWTSLKSFNISKGLPNEESESFNSKKVLSENSVPTMSECKHEHLSNEDNTRKESEELKKTELNMDIDLFVDDAFSYISSNSLRQETNIEISQDSILYNQNKAKTNHTEFINENNFILSGNESQQNKAINEETSVKFTSKSDEFKNELVENDKDFYNEGIENTEFSTQTLDTENSYQEKIEDSNLICENTRGENNIEETLEYQLPHTQCTLDQEMNNGENTSEKNGTSSNELISGINIDVSEASLSGGEINLEANVQYQLLHKQTKPEQKENNGEKMSSNNDTYTASKNVLSSGDNNVGGRSSPPEDKKPSNYKIISENVKPLVIDFTNNVNIKTKDDWSKSKNTEENLNAKIVLNNTVIKDMYQKYNNIEIISKPKIINRNKDHVNVTIRSSSSSSLTESVKNSTPIRQVTTEQSNEQHDLINLHMIANKPGTQSLLPVKVVPTNASTKMFQQKSYTVGRDSDKRKTIKIIQKTKARAPLPPQLRSKFETSSANPVEKDVPSLSRTLSIRNSEFSNKLNELLKTKLETGPQPITNSLKNTNSKSVNDLVNLKETNEQVLLSSDYHNLPGNSPNYQKGRQGTVYRSFNNKDRISSSDLQIKEPASTIVSTKDENIVPPFSNDNSEEKRKEIKKKLENLFTQKIKPLERPSIRPKVQSTETMQEEFDIIKRQRLLMGDVLASIKLVKNKSGSSVQNSPKTDSVVSSASEDEVFTRDNLNNSIIIQNKRSTQL